MKKNPISFNIQSEYLKGKVEEEEKAEAKDERQNLNISIRQIENGWIIRESWDEPCDDGCGTRWKEREMYSATNPVEVK
jgi:hypothetical protein